MHGVRCFFTFALEMTETFGQNKLSNIERTFIPIPSVNNVLGMLTAMLHFQLKEIPEDFFVDIVSKNNFLTVVLQVWCIISVYMLHYLNRPLFLPC